MNPSQKSLQARIRDVYEELTGNESKLADVILAAPGEVATHTAAELSGLSGISAATTTRFFRRLGYESYEEARRQARDAQKSGSPLYLQELHPKATEVGKLVRSHLDNELLNITATYQALDLKTVETVVKKMAGARRLGFIGYRHSQPIASMLYRNLLETRDDVYLLPPPADTMGESLAKFGSKDFVVCVGLRRRARQLSEVMEWLASAGVPTLYISDVIVGKPGKFAKWIIRCHTKGLLMFDSVAAATAVANLLYSLTAQEIASTHPGHLESIERIHERLKELE